jgi:hypothetical protein
VRFSHLYINGVDPPDPQDPIAKAQAYFPGSGETDVQFDDSDPWQEIGTTHIPDIFGAATHEIGHTLGLDHPPDHPEAVMYWIFKRFQGLNTGYLSADDIAGVRAIYGMGHGTVTPLAVPEPSALILAVLGVVLLVSRCRLR